MTDTKIVSLADIRNAKQGTTLKPPNRHEIEEGENMAEQCWLLAKRAADFRANGIDLAAARAAVAYVSEENPILNANDLLSDADRAISLLSFWRIALHEAIREADDGGLPPRSA